LQKADHRLGGRALGASCLLVNPAELPLGEVTVVALQLLLGAQLLTIVGELAHTPVTVLAGAAVALVDGALRTAPDVLTEAAIDLVLRANALRHFRGTPISSAIAVERPLLCPARPGRQATTASDRLPRVRKSNAGHRGPRRFP